MTETNEQQNIKTKTSKGIGFVFNSAWLTEHLYFFLFLSMIAVLYIANGHLSDKTLRNIDKTKRELRDLQFEYKTVKAELMHKSEEAEVLKMAEPLGLTISTEVPKRLQLQKTK